MTPADSADPLRLAEAFRQVADALAAEQTTEATLNKICHLAVGATAGCDHCGVAVLQQGAIVTASATGPIPRRLDELQNQTGEGPALDAVSQHDIIQADHLSSERRWPTFARRAAQATGVESVLAFPLFSVSGPLGVLELYADAPQKLQTDVPVRSIGAVFAAHVGAVLIQSRRVEQLEEAIQTRDLIGQAKGILMAEQHLTADQAFERLRDVSQRQNRKLRDIAAEVAYTGTLPG